MRDRACIAAMLSLLVAGCGTTRWSDTQRTATEQLLISDAMDRAVSGIDCATIAGHSVYLDFSPLRNVVDAPYLISTVRQHLLASDCLICEKPEDAEFVVELRAGAVGTDRRDLLFGVPATTLPSPVPGTSGTTVIPELPIIKRTEQRAVAKIAVFVYDRDTGQPVWQSGASPTESRARDVWVLGAGPFQQGNIYDGTKFAGSNVPTVIPGMRGSNGKPRLSVTQEAIFSDPDGDMSSPWPRERPKVAAKSTGVKPKSIAIPDDALAQPAPAPQAVGPVQTQSNTPKFDLNAPISVMEAARRQRGETTETK